MKNNILIINGHPAKDSFCHALALKYYEGVKNSKTNVKMINLIDLNFSPVLLYGYSKRTELEPYLVNIQKEIEKADHMVFIYPTWWGTYPAILKGFIDRVFLPEFAFKYQEKSPFPEKLLSGRSARLIITMDTPPWYYNIIYKKPGHNSMKKSVLNFCGVKPVKITALGPIRKSNQIQRKKWLDKIEVLGKLNK